MSAGTVNWKRIEQGRLDDSAARRCGRHCERW
jgi:hypothetical protein